MDSKQKEQLSATVSHLIRGNEEAATAAIHDYFVSKMQEVAGLKGIQPKTEHSEQHQSIRSRRRA